MHWRRVRVFLDALELKGRRRRPRGYLEAVCDTRGEAARAYYELNAEDREERAFRRYMGGGA